jgi:hypothetical protein
VFRNDLPAGQGGVPVVDGERYLALQGSYPVAATDVTGDPVILVSCGPFATLAPGQSIDVAFAIVAGPAADSLVLTMGSAVFLHHGTERNLLPDSVDTHEWNLGVSGLNGHESCIEPPAGVTFDVDPHCANKLRNSILFTIPEEPAHFEHGHCIWTDADCDGCTGKFGRETPLRWLDPGSVPSAPASRVRAGDHQVTVAWDNMAEILLRTGIIPGGFSFSGYRIYRISDWRDRKSLMPPPDHWEQIAAFSTRDSINGQQPLELVVDSTVTSDRDWFGQPHYPVGRYRFVDRDVLNGFDYVYVVTTLAERSTFTGGVTLVEQTESPLVASFDSLVVPHTSSQASAGRVWVVPNPFRAHADWDRTRVPGDPFGRHLDFMGLPKALVTIKVWTLAGDFVARIDHDGSAGDGQASWNLISRSGQDVVSGVYLFTVDWASGHQLGRFLIIR